MNFFLIIKIFRSSSIGVFIGDDAIFIKIVAFCRRFLLCDLRPKVFLSVVYALIAVHAVRNGHRKDGTQRYVCKDCGKSFVITANSILFGTRKDLSVWEKYIDCMMNGLSISKSADACGIHKNTAFLWRHKILDALQNMADDVALDGIIEADETFFAVSYKGNHSKSRTFAMPREARKCGHSAHIRGLSKENVCVPCAVNRNDLSISKITNTGRVSAKKLHHIYDGRVKTDSILVTDKMNSYVRFANASGIIIGNC